MPFITEGSPAERRARQHARAGRPSHLGYAIAAALLGIIVIGILLIGYLGELGGNVADLHSEVVTNRVVGCQRFVDEHLPLPSVCRVPAITHLLTSAP
jgi:hypothetical protein